MKRLEEESKKTGASMAELVRRAIDKTYPVGRAGKKKK